jgi:hypothetical protein
MSPQRSNSAGSFDGDGVIGPGWTLRDVPVPPGYLAALAVEGEAPSVRVLPWSPSQGISRGHQPRTSVGGVLLAVAAAQRRLLLEAHEARHYEPEGRGVDEQHRAAEDRRLAEDDRDHRDVHRVAQVTADATDHELQDERGVSALPAAGQPVGDEPLIRPGCATTKIRLPAAAPRLVTGQAYASQAGAGSSAADHHLPVCAGAAGSCTVTQSPPSARGMRVRAPS